jgi:hypothetical protein
MKNDKTYQIQNLCEFLCDEFGTEGRSIVFKLDILSKLLKEEKLSDDDCVEFCSKMSDHGYGTLIANDTIYMIHFTLLNSIREIDEEDMHLRFAKYDKIPMLPDDDFNKHMH